MEIEIKLLEMMARKGFRTIQELHEVTGISRNSLSLMLKGNTNANLATIEKLCKALDCDLHNLIVYKRK